ncbi:MULTISPECIES: glucan biosynthesis protein D [unclassified Modicisalibacter]|uniref:glucan biosynthesis protein n=1 Tax=unclassified Modicisalibacter TaxID=2679913 RepID=UPI001CD0264A|nr:MULTISPECIES: glucan biosynthesis protein D [unclassified Modicisalibacter]MBZ9556531.1 glucan biosynthesis protein D [Modicisalibacter sp. R2A 31.J]MBZ9575000.1 glucan biosynthesis protein D [Modicisalibacter sp. MOD 31.J]
MNRRDFLKATSVLGGAFLPLSSVLAAVDAPAKTIGPSESFSYAWLKGLARHLSEQKHDGAQENLPAELQGLSWDEYQAISFRKDQDLWADIDRARYRAELFHLGLYFRKPVKIYEIVDGQAREIAYDPAMFDYGKSGIDGDALPKDLGFAGFRLFHDNDWKRDMVAFLGASYFRAVSDSMQYGMSARGLAIDTGLPRDEEFPDFTRFWLERPDPQSNVVTVYALLESASTTGAYRFAINIDDGVTMDVDTALYPRKAIERLGIAPMTSMYMVGENDQAAYWDWRPEIHDSDGLAMHTGSGEWLWRPLLNPRQLRFNAYADQNPKGFGLLQRDRNFDHYQDDGVFYDRRPSVWIEPKSDWGKGAIDLIEIPTLDETFDNIVAFWNPDQPVQPGDELLFGYRIYWCDYPPSQPELARCVATRTGLGGEVGQKREYFSWRFAIDFQGGPFPFDADQDVEVVPVIENSAGRIEITSARPLHSINGYRAMFDVVPPDDGSEPINLRVYLKAGDEPLTETWVYQWTPPPAEDRELHNPGHLS